MEKTVGALFAKRLKDLMAVRPDLDTQVKLASAAHMSQTTVGRILNQKVSPTLEHVASIADAFGLTIGQMIAQDVDGKNELRYDRKAFAALTPPQKKSIESLIEHNIQHYAIVNNDPPHPILTKDTASAAAIRPNRKPTHPTDARTTGEDSMPTARNDRREHDA
jgi:transcriptional regulator with XRE-family HTH domain